MKINLFKIVFSFILLIAFTGLSAQTHTISGTVKDKADGTGIPGVNVIEKGTQNGTITDIDGNYSLSLSSKTATLQFSFIGYKKLEQAVNGMSKIDIELAQDVTALDELVVIGYGMQKKKVVTGAIASVKSEDIAKLPILRAEQALQGRTPGVQVTQLSGQPGEAPTIRIRGIGTTGNSDPLYIVDGMAVENIEFINPSDIESLDVLKDAASAAIYGARAANGVVLITTKSGKAGKMNVTYSAYYGIQNTANRLEMLNAAQYTEIVNEALTNAGRTKGFIDPNEITADTDWQDEIFETNAPMQEHSLLITGGNEKSTYSSSLAYFSQEGIIGGDKSKFERVTGRFNATHKVNNRFTFGNNLAVSHINKRQIGSNESFNGVYSSALNLDPLTPLYEDDEDVLATDPYLSHPVVTDANGRVYGISDENILGAGGEVVNPVALLETQTATTRSERLVGSVFGELEIIKGLKAKTNAGIDINYETEKSHKPLYYLNGAQSNETETSANKEYKRYSTWQWENTLTYIKKISDHQLSALIGTTASESKYENLTGFSTNVNVLDPDNVYLATSTADTSDRSNEEASHSALWSQFGRVTYDYKSRYAFTGTIRRDGSSRFGANNRFGIFPSLGVSWFITDEPFMPELGPINYLKFRFSLGENGNEKIGDYQYISIMDASRGYTFGSGRMAGSSPEYIENADIHWEESVQTDVAIDLGAFENKLTLTFDYYIKNTNGLLEQVSIPSHVGNGAPYSNAGSVQNKGIEIDLKWRDQINDFKYTLGFNAGYNKNEMTHIANEEKVISGASWSVFQDITRSEEGLPIAFFYGYKTDGIFQNDAEIYQHIGSTGDVLQPLAVPGDVRFVDVNDDGVINDDDRTMIGKPTPDVIIGINGSVDYKGFDMSFMFSGAYGHQIFNGTQRQDLDYTNRTTAILDRWTGEGTSNTVPRVTYSDINNNYRISDLYIEDGDYLKLKNVQLGYSFKQSLLERVGIQACRIYVSGENLLTFTKYTGVDPEIGALGSFDIGIDRGVYPQARTFRFGTSVTF